jgi:hypothetical protein
MAERENLISAYPLEWPAGRVRAKRRVEGNFNRYKKDEGTNKRRYFRWTLAAAREDILSELEKFNAKKIVLSSNQPITDEGRFYNSRRILADPGVAVYFEKGGKQLVVFCDKFTDLEDNIRACSRTINAFRQIERDGTSDLLESVFVGFKALPETAGGFKWWEVLGVSMNATEEQVLEAFRAKVKTAHPDNGGSAEEFNNVTRAREMALAGLKKE